MAGSGARLSPIAVVFLQGIGGAARRWRPQVEAFEQAGFDPVALDLPGNGVRPPVETMDFAMLAADVEASVDRRRLDRPVLVGHSFGGMIAQSMLRRRPDGYRAAVLSATSNAFGNPDGDFQRKFVAARLGPLDAGRTMAELAPDIVAGIMAPAADPAGRALAVETMAAEGGAAAAGVAAFGTEARPVDGGFIVNGKKIFACVMENANAIAVKAIRTCWGGAGYTQDSSASIETVDAAP